MTHSYNGWPFIPATEVVRAVVPGTHDVRIEIRRGDVATILNAWAALWHRRVRPLDTYRPRDYWGWSATNDHPTSCHLSGTAVDLNATTLPFRLRTMPADQRAAVDDMVHQFRGVVAWGGHWTNPADEMHAEIALPPGDRRVADLAADLSAGYLGVYTSPTEPPQEGITVSEADRIIKFIQDYIGPNNSDTKDNREQLTGGRDLVPGDAAASYPGWDLARLVASAREKSFTGLTLVEMVAVALAGSDADRTAARTAAEVTQ